MNQVLQILIQKGMINTNLPAGRQHRHQSKINF